MTATMTDNVSEAFLPKSESKPDDIQSLRSQIDAVRSELAAIRERAENTDNRLKLLRQEFDHVQRQKSLWGR